MNKILTLCALLGLAGGALAGTDSEAAFHTALARELDNRALAAPAAVEDAAFLRYMIEQKSVQATALAQAAAQRFDAAAGELEGFVARGRE